MSRVTIAEFKEHFETDLSDLALLRLLDDAEAEIDERYGELTTETDTLEENTEATALFLSRKAESITTVVEEVKSGDGSYEEITLSTNDYKIRHEGREIERLAGGDNPRRTWADIVTVVYVPKDETARRTRVTIDLVKLAIQYNATKGETVGDYKVQSVDYESERSKILARLESWPWA